MDSSTARPLQLRGKLVLASASPRRREILGSLGIPFEIEPSDVDEDLRAGIEPEAAATELALRKAAEVAARYAGQVGWVIGSDTIVAHGEGSATRMLAKPEDAAEAQSMLERLSDSRHRVITGVCVVDLARFQPAEPDGLGTFLAYERTWVTMRTILPEEVHAYVASGEWRGKAGGYAIQENADAFVLSLEEGGFDNVVGLPLTLTLELLQKAGAFLAP
jgi:septum formation protein